MTIDVKTRIKSLALLSKHQNLPEVSIYSTLMVASIMLETPRTPDHSTVHSLLPKRAIQSLPFTALTAH